MKGLLLKDWYLILRYERTIFLLLIFFLVAGVAVENSPLFFLAYPCMLSAMIPITLYSIDDREHFTTYSATLPMSRAQYVSGKYLIGLASLLLVILATVLVQQLAVHTFRPHLTYLSLGDLSAVSAMSLLAPAVCLPLMLKLGVEKARIVYYVSIGIICLLLVGFNTDHLTALPVHGALPLLLSLLLYAGSWVLSIRWYRGRDL